MVLAPSEFHKLIKIFCQTFNSLSTTTANMATIQIPLPLPFLPTGWTGEKDFKALGQLSAPVHREIEPVGQHFLAHARRKRHKRTFSEDERIQAAENVKKVEDVDDGEISEPEDPMMLGRDAKDWKVWVCHGIFAQSIY